MELETVGTFVLPIMDDIIEKLFETLEIVPENRTLSNGKPLSVDDTQLINLTTLELVFPNELAASIDMLEQGRARVIKHAGCEAFLVKEEFPSLITWKCTCMDTITELEADVSKWKRSCAHLLAAYIYNRQFPIISYKVAVENVSFNEYMNYLNVL